MSYSVYCVCQKFESWLTLDKFIVTISRFTFLAHPAHDVVYVTHDTKTTLFCWSAYACLIL